MNNWASRFKKWSPHISTVSGAVSAVAAMVTVIFAAWQITASYDLANLSERRQALRLVWDASKEACQSAIPDPVRAQFIYLPESGEVVTASSEFQSLSEIAVSIASNSAASAAEIELAELATRYATALSKADATSFRAAYETLQAERKNAFEAMLPERENAKATGHTREWISAVYRYEERCINDAHEIRIGHST